MNEHDGVRQDGHPGVREDGSDGLRPPTFDGFRLSEPVACVTSSASAAPSTSASVARVWRARRAADGAEVAIKILPAEQAARAAREAEIAAMIEHPHVVAPSEVVFSADAEAVGVVLPWYDDGSLADLIAVRRRLRWPEVLTVLIPLADALASAHERGFVHGDLSPANVLFDPVGRPMLADFGAARAATETGAEVYATACDVAPEIVRGAAPSPATDLFSLGSVALACLTGRPAWFADDLQDVLVQSTAGQWPDLEDNMAPPALRRLVRRLLAPEAADRGTAAGLAVDLRRVGEPEPVDIASPDSLPDSTLDPSPLAPRAATTVRPDALRPPADDRQPESDGTRLRAGALIASVRRVVGAVMARLSWRGAVATGAVAALAWGAMAFGWASAASPAGDVALPAAVGESVPLPAVTTTDAAIGIGSDRQPAVGATTAVAPAPAPVVASVDAVPAVAAVSAAGESDAGDGDPAEPDWLAVMERLDRARAAAFITRDVSRLAEVYAPGVAARQEDVRRITAMTAQGLRVRDAAHRLITVSPVAIGPDGDATLDIAEAQDSQRLYGADGTVVGAVPAVAVTTRVVHLVVTGDGYRIDRIEKGQRR